MMKFWIGLLLDLSPKFMNKYCFHKQIPLKRRVLLLKEWVLCFWIWGAPVQTFHGRSNTRKGCIKANIQGMPLERASMQPSRAMHPKTNENNNSLLASAGFIAKLATKKRIIVLRTHLIDYSTTTAKYLHSNQDHSSQVRKNEARTMLKIDMQW